MKTVKTLGLLAVTVLLAASCSKKKMINEVSSDVQDGTWRVTYYNDSGVDHTSDFDGYTFTFSDNGEVQATNGTNTITGTWSVTKSNSDDDDSNSDVDFNLAFSTPADFAELTDDWDILSNSNTKIELIDVSGGNGETDYLTFEKN